MKREDRRKMKKKSVMANLKKAKAFVTVMWDGKGMPIVSYDVTPCLDEKDLRHYVMQRIAEWCEVSLNEANAALAKKEAERKESARVAEAKEKRSAELALEAPDTKIIGVLNPET